MCVGVCVCVCVLCTYAITIWLCFGAETVHFFIFLDIHIKLQKLLPRYLLLQTTMCCDTCAKKIYLDICVICLKSFMIYTIWLGIFESLNFHGLGS